MKQGRTVVVCVLSGALLAPVAFAASNPNPNANGYDAIAVSNPFRLKPIPPPTPVTPPEPAKPPSAKLILQGITDILGQKMAMLEVLPPNNGPKTHVTLSEGERSGEIEIVSIDVVAGVVQVLNQGRPDSLDFSAATKTVKASLPSVAIPSATLGGTTGESLPAPTGAPKAITLPTSRNIRTGGAASSALTPMTPTLPSLFPGGGAAPATADKDAPLKPEEQIILMEINRELTKEKVIKGELPPLPPTPLTPPGLP